MKVVYKSPMRPRETVSVEYLPLTLFVLSMWQEWLYLDRIVRTDVLRPGRF